MKPTDIRPGESVSLFTGPIPPEMLPMLPNAKLHLSATCGRCGGQLIPHKRKPLVWICQRSRWWNRRKHSYLQGSVTIVKADRKADA